MLAFAALCVLLLVGHGLRTRIRLLQWLYLPACVIAGLVGLILLQALDAAAPAAGWLAAANETAGQWKAAWKPLPGLLINVVFACLFMGVTLPKFSSLLKRSGTQLAYGQIVAWGQYVVGVGLVLFVLAGPFGLNDMFGGILPVGFEGGHGTAGGLGPTFEKLGWAEGQDFAIASATGGVMSAIVVGMVLINIATRRGWATQKKSPADVPADDSIGIIPVDRRPSAGKLTVKADAIESFTLHLAMVGVAVLIGWLLLQIVVGAPGAIAWFLEETGSWPRLVNALRGAESLFKGIPLFPLCMMGGLIVQIWEQKFDRHKLIDLGLMRRIQNSALDFLVVAAIATINVKVIESALTPLLILIAAGIAWNVFCVLVLARRLLPDHWFERSIAEMGQSMGVTATGLLLLRVVDPDYKTPTADAFAAKQLLHEPIMGGGLWTALAIPLLADPNWGPTKVLAIASSAVAIWMIVLIVIRVASRKGASA